MTAGTGTQVLVTGASGLLGRAVVEELRAHGHGIVALVADGDEPPAGVPTFVGDAADAELVRSAVAEVVRTARGGPTAVVHLAAIPAPIGPGERVFANNTASTYTVLEAAGRAGLGCAVVSSSIAALGLAFGRDHLRPAYLPVDEDHPTLAEDPYALSKVVTESTVCMMYRRWGLRTVAMRFPFVGSGERLAIRLREAREDPGALRHDLWGYLYTDDAARAVRTAVEQCVPGCHVVTVAAPDTVCDVPTPELLARYLPQVPTLSQLPGHRTLHDLTRVTELLGFEARRSWRDTAPSVTGLPAPSEPTGVRSP